MDINNNNNKVCRGCNIAKAIEKFKPNTRVCKQCRNKKYNTINNEKNKDFFKEYYTSNRDEFCQKARERYYRNKEVEQQLV
jgi:hypothetical protein